MQGSSKVWVQARALPLRKVGGLAAEEVFIRTPSMVLAISSDEARKFDGSSLSSGGGLFVDDDTKRAEFAHLRVKVPHLTLTLTLTLTPTFTLPQPLPLP